MLRIWALYEPLKTFSYFAAIFLVFGLALITRFGVLYFAAGEKGPRHVQSLIIAMIFLMIGAVIAAVALLSDSIATNRRLLEEQLRRTKEMQFQLCRIRAPVGHSFAAREDLRLPARRLTGSSRSCLSSGTGKRGIIRSLLVPSSSRDPVARGR